VVAPGEPIPTSLAEAIARGREASHQVSSTPSPAKDPPRHAGSSGAHVLPPGSGATLPPRTFAPMTGGYCFSQFWTDWGNWYATAPARTAGTWSYGWMYQDYNNWSGQIGVIVCPKGDVSGTGGELAYYDGHSNPAWTVAPNYYRWYVETAGVSCGWDFYYWCTHCSSVNIGAEADYYSACYQSTGSSCGDNFDWISFATTRAPYCE
jgi:hypothetical protein